MCYGVTATRWPRRHRGEESTMIRPKFRQGDVVVWNKNTTDYSRHVHAKILERPIIGLCFYDGEEWSNWLDRKEVTYLIKSGEEVLFVAECVLEEAQIWKSCSGEHRKNRGAWEKKEA